MTAAERALALRKGWCPGALRPMLTGDGWLVRVRITAGIVPAALARAVASCARAHGNGLVDLSARANLQLRGVTDATLAPLTERLRDLGLLDDEEAGEARRNVIASPLAGIAPDAPIDIRPLVAALERELVAAGTLDELPPKFGFLVDDGGSPGLDDVACDVRFEAAQGGNGEVGFRVRLGGDAASGAPAGFCTPAGLPDAAARIAAAFLALRGTGPDAAGRMSALVRRVGPEPIARLAGLAPAAALASPRRAAAAPLGLLPDGATLGVAAPFGRWTADDLDLLAGEAERSGRGELRLTPWRAVLLPGIGAARAARLAAEWADRFVVDPSDPRLAVAACPGAPACGNATTFTHRDALALADAARGLAREGVAVHVSGCAKGCARQAASTVTLVGRDGAYDVVYAGTARDEPARRGVAPERLAETIREAAEAARTTV